MQYALIKGLVYIRHPITAQCSDLEYSFLCLNQTTEWWKMLKGIVLVYRYNILNQSAPPVNVLWKTQIVKIVLI